MFLRREDPLKNSGNAVRASSKPHLDALRGLAGIIASSSVEVRIVTGHAPIAEMQGMLEELCERTGQPGAMDSLDYFLSLPSARSKTPHLVLVGLDSHIPPESACADDVAGAVLLYEYSIARLGMEMGTKVFATDDVTGQRTVIASPEVRAAVGEIACRALIARGAHIAMISLAMECDPQLRVVPPRGEGRRAIPDAMWLGTRSRDVPQYLPLAATLDATLATLGRHTRHNLRRYRKRLEADLGTRFVSAVAMSRDEFRTMNLDSTYPVSEAEVSRRYEAMERGFQSQAVEGMFAGLQDRDGRWLSLIGGRRHRGLLEIDWQMNLAGLPNYSLSTVMRSYVLEHEIALGTVRLIFEGGTPHSIRHSLASARVLDLVAVRRSPTAWAMARSAPWIFPKKNFLRQALVDEGMEWRRG